MESLRFFRRTYKDPVVEYYFLPWRDDIRLTRRFGLVYVHVRTFSAFESANVVWRSLSSHQKLAEAEYHASRIMLELPAHVVLLSSFAPHFQVSCPLSPK